MKNLLGKDLLGEVEVDSTVSGVASSIAGGL